MLLKTYYLNYNTKIQIYLFIKGIPYLSGTSFKSFIQSSQSVSIYQELGYVAGDKDYSEMIKKL